jgi:hypothetical protein
MFRGDLLRAGRDMLSPIRRGRDPDRVDLLRRIYLVRLWRLRAFLRPERAVRALRLQLPARHAGLHATRPFDPTIYLLPRRSDLLPGRIGEGRRRYLLRRRDADLHARRRVFYPVAHGERVGRRSAAVLSGSARQNDRAINASGKHQSVMRRHWALMRTPPCDGGRHRCEG